MSVAVLRGGEGARTVVAVVLRRGVVALAGADRQKERQTDTYSDKGECCSSAWR